jgi:hypothetical protein
MWWTGAAGLILFHPFLRQMNPLDVVVSALFVLIAALWLWYEEQRESAPRSLSLLLGLCLGAALATRLHVAALFSLPLLVALTVRGGIKRGLVVSATAAISAIALNPLLWFAPESFLRVAILDQFVYFTSATAGLVILSDFSWLEMVRLSPLATISFMLALIYLFFPALRSPLPRHYIFLLLVSSLFTLSVMQLANLRVYRFALPILFIWEAFLPLFIWQLMGTVRVPVLPRLAASSQISWALKSSVIGIMIGGQFITWLYLIVLS